MSLIALNEEEKKGELRNRSIWRFVLLLSASFFGRFASDFERKKQKKTKKKERKEKEAKHREREREKKVLI